MLITLYNYASDKTRHDIGDIKNIYFAEIKVLSGDEVLNVVHNDGTKKVYDSSACRFNSHYDGSYIVYVPNIINLFEDTKWLCRKDSYSYRGE